MSDYSSMATLQNNSQTAGFAAAVQRARLVAAKLEGGGSKRPLEEGPEPNAKKLASVEVAYQQQQQMSAPSAVAVVSRAAAPPASAAPPPPPNAGAGSLMPDQTLNEYIRVPDKMVGLIIGRGGEQITRLQAESGCKIQMAPDSGGQPDRLCTLTGSREAILRAKELVNQIVNHRGRENAPQHGEGAGAGGGPGMPPPPPRGAQGSMAQEEIMLPGPKVGLIIGKNGKTIKQLQEQSGAKMVVIQDGPNTEYEKPLRISGDPAKVEHAKQLVYELLADKDMQQGGGPRPPPYDDNYAGHDQGNGLATNSTEVLVPKVAVGIVIGRGGDMIKKIQAETGCRVQFHQERDDGPNDKRCYLQGKPHQVDQARQMIEDLISSVNRREQEVRAGRGRGGAAARNGERGAGDYAAWQDAQEIRVTFTVSNVKCGLIIGRGGEVIKQINAESGAHCELDRRAQGSDRNNRTFYIRGHPEAVDHCKRIIMEKVGMPVNFIQEGSNGGNGGNGNGNGNGGNGGEYYGGGGGGGPPAWGYNPHWHQPAQQQAPQQQVQINPATGQPDYSQQWIDYYRSLGLMREAEAIEQQAKQQQQQQQQQPQPDLLLLSLNITFSICYVNYEIFRGFDIAKHSHPTTAVSTNRHNLFLVKFLTNSSFPHLNVTTSNTNSTNSTKPTPRPKYRPKTKAKVKKRVNKKCPETESPMNIGTYEVPTQRDLVQYTKRILMKFFNSYHEKTLFLLKDIKEATRATMEFEKRCNSGKAKISYRECVKQVSKKCVAITKDLVASLEKQKMEVVALTQEKICDMNSMRIDPIELIKILAMDEATMSFALPAFLRLLGGCSSYCFMESPPDRRPRLRQLTDQDLVVRHFLTSKNYVQLINDTTTYV